MRTLIGLTILAVWTSPLSGQDTTGVAPDSSMPATPTVYRNPKRALILGSVIPGAGHIYAGEYVHGFLVYEATVSTIGLGVVAFIVDKCMLSFLSATRCDSGPQWPHQVLGVALVGAGIWEWVSSARDARRAAERANERHHANELRVTPVIQGPVDSHSGWKLGTAIQW